MSAGDRPKLVSRPGGGVRFLGTFEVDGVTPNSLLGAQDDGAGGTEIVGFPFPGILDAPDAAQDGTDDGKVLTVVDVGGGQRQPRWQTPGGGGGGSCDAQLRACGRHVVTGTGSYLAMFWRDDPTADATTIDPPPLSLPSGNHYVRGLRVRVVSSNLSGNAMLRVYINGIASTIALDVTGLVAGNTATDLMHIEEVADDDTVALVLEVNGGNVVAEVFQFVASLALTRNGA